MFPEYMYLICAAVAVLATAGFSWVAGGYFAPNSIGEPKNKAAGIAYVVMAFVAIAVALGLLWFIYAPGHIHPAATAQTTTQSRF